MADSSAYAARRVRRADERTCSSCNFTLAGLSIGTWSDRSPEWPHVLGLACSVGGRGRSRHL